MTDAEYIPDQGHLIWLTFDPQAGHEQNNRRPAVVLSPVDFNRIGLCICCPVTRQVKGLPFEVPLTGGSEPAAVLVQHVKSQDWRARKAEFIRRIDPAELAEVRARVKALI